MCFIAAFSRILLEKVGGTYLSLCNKNSDLNFLENFTRKGGRGYLPIFSRILLEKVGGTYLSLCNKNSDLNFQKFLLENEVGGTYLSFPGFY